MKWFLSEIAWVGRLRAQLLVVVAALFVAACSNDGPGQVGSLTGPSEGDLSLSTGATTAKADLAPANGSNVHGRVVLVSNKNLHVTGTARRLDPELSYGSLIYQSADCSPPGVFLGTWRVNPAGNGNLNVKTGSVPLEGIGSVSVRRTDTFALVACGSVTVVN